MTLPKTKREESKIIVFTYQSCWKSRWDPMREVFAIALPGKGFNASFLTFVFPDIWWVLRKGNGLSGQHYKYRMMEISDARVRQLSQCNEKEDDTLEPAIKRRNMADHSASVSRDIAEEELVPVLSRGLNKLLAFSKPQLDSESSRGSVSSLCLVG